MEEEIDEVVRSRGWYGISVSDHSPPFLYSVGLMKSCDHPELIVFGLNAQASAALFEEIISKINSGETFDEPAVHPDVLGLRIGIRRVHPTQHPLYFGYAMGYCRYIGKPGGLNAVQVFWPDRRGEIPL